MAAAGSLLSFGSLAVDALFPSFSESLTGYVLPAVGFALMFVTVVGMEIFIAKSLRAERPRPRLQP